MSNYLILADQFNSWQNMNNVMCCVLFLADKLMLCQDSTVSLTVLKHEFCSCVSRLHRMTVHVNYLCLRYIPLGTV